MKYIVRLTLVNFLGINLTEDELTEKPEGSLRQIFSTYEKVFRGNLVPRIGESFPLLRDCHDHYWRIAKVVNIVHESSNYDEDDKRMPVIILEDQYMGESYQGHHFAINKHEQADRWQSLKSGEIVINAEHNAMTLKQWRFCRIHGPSPQRLTMNFAVTRTAGVLD